MPPLSLLLKTAPNLLINQYPIHKNLQRDRIDHSLLLSNHRPPPNVVRPIKPPKLPKIGVYFHKRLLFLSLGIVGHIEHFPPLNNIEVSTAGAPLKDSVPLYEG